MTDSDTDQSFLYCVESPAEREVVHHNRSPGQSLNCQLLMCTLSTAAAMKTYTCHILSFPAVLTTSFIIYEYHNYILCSNVFL